MRGRQYAVILGLGLAMLVVSGCGAQASQTSHKAAHSASTSSRTKATSSKKVARSSTSSARATSSHTTHRAVVAANYSASAATTSTTTAASASSATKASTPASTFVFDAIQRGDYSSTVGSWHLVAYAANRYDGNGIQWQAGVADIVSDYVLQATATRVTDGALVLQAGKISDPQDADVPTTSKLDGQTLTLTNTGGTQSNSVVFMQPNATFEDLGAASVQVDRSKAHIMFRTSNNGFSDLFERQ